VNRLARLPIPILLAIAFAHVARADDDMVNIPAGEFVMGSAEAEDNAPRRSVRLETFYIARYEVTNGEYAAFDPDHRFPPGAERHPVTHVTWDEARAFCERAGKRLPSAEEWEKAARGADGRIYPWGESPLKAPPHPAFSGVVKRRVDRRKDDVSPYGVYGMASSVWEWTATDDGDQKIAKGGLWNLHLDYAYSKTYDSLRIPSDRRLPFLGFRCAASLDAKNE
jgi:formylglycine-generating enzyme required for sulfatase activity